jgi:hypothetical protein
MRLRLRENVDFSDYLKVAICFFQFRLFYLTKICVLHEVHKTMNTIVVFSLLCVLIACQDINEM